jgi:hypothetical protein
MIDDEIEKTMASLDGITRAEANPYLYEKVIDRIKKGRGPVFPSRSLVVRISAACLILVLLNMFTWISMFNVHKEDKQADLHLLYEEYIDSGRITGL